MLQEFDLEIKDRRGADNSVADHLSRLVLEEESLPISETFPDEQLLHLQGKEPWFADIVNFLVAGILPNDLNKAKKNKVKNDSKYYVWDEPYLWKIGSDQIIRRCVPDDEIHSILTYCHSYACDGHFGPKRTARKILDSGFYWETLFKDAYQFCKSSEKCQRMGSLSRRNEMPQTPILYCEIFDVWVMDFMGLSLFYLVLFLYCSLWIMFRNG